MSLALDNKQNDAADSIEYDFIGLCLYDFLFIVLKVIKTTYFEGNRIFNCQKTKII